MQAREAEEEAEKLRQAELEKEKEKNKGAKGAKPAKKGKSRSPSPKKRDKGSVASTPPPGEEGFSIVLSERLILITRGFVHSLNVLWYFEQLVYNACHH